MANPPKQDTEFKRFAAKRIIIGIILIVAVLWTLGGIMGIIERPEPIPQSALDGKPHEATTEDTGDHGQAGVAGNTATHDTPAQMDTHDASAKNAAHVDPADAGKSGHEDAPASDTHDSGAVAGTVGHGDDDESLAKDDTSHSETTSHSEPATEESVDASHSSNQEAKAVPDAHGDTDQGTATNGAAEESGHEAAVTEAIAPKLPEHKEKGVATVEAIIGPMEYELEERFWGWRPNDLINITDNVNYYQLGVLEVTRRAVVALNERISRTGVTDSFDTDLENSTNWFMIKATKYWFPAAESKYREGVNDLKKYSESLQAKRATFYTRPDNLIPLLASFEDLLGSCDENLVKHLEEDGSEVGWLKADNYYFYAQGVAAAMAPILEAIHHDFLITLETRHGIELLHHAVESCQTAAALDPWLITNSSLDGILANHRANMAAPISHARFYIGVLIKALST